MKKPLRMTVNGDTVELLVDPRDTLLDALRNELHLTGSKEGCGNGNCGACTVILDGRAVNSCLVFALEASGREVVTIEGIARDGKLHPLQEAFIKHGALQCGFCTPGFIVMAKDYLDRNPHPDEQQVRRALSGNLCRCTGYDKIVRAVMAVARKGSRPRSAR